MTPPHAIEIVNHRLVEGADPDRFLDINRVVGAEFTSAQPGFVRREIGGSDDGTWLTWVSMAPGLILGGFMGWKVEVRIWFFFSAANYGMVDVKSSRKQTKGTRGRSYDR